MYEFTAVKPPKMTKVEVSPYEKEKVEHLTDQLIKLQKSYETANSNSLKIEILKAMQTINKNLEVTLTPKSILNFNY